MATRRGSKVWVKNVGWVKKRDTSDRDYSDYQTEAWAFLMSFFRWYPDVLLDILRSPEARYPNEELIQRVMMRVFARYQFVDITGCRSLTKTSTTFKTKMVLNLLWPGTKTAYYGPSLKQQAKLAKSAYTEIKESYPALTRHWAEEAMGKDDFSISTEFNSRITINSTRGDNIHNVVAEEYAQEDGGQPFDHDEYATAVLYAVRLVHMVRGERDRTAVPYQQHSITSAGRKQNPAYETRNKHMMLMKQGKSAFVMDVPWQVIVLSQMRTYAWAMQRRAESTPDKWFKEMESRYSGTDKNPVVRDEVLAVSRKLLRMEEHHCCRDPECKLRPQDVIYVVGYDVSYEDNKNNAKCAAVVLKLTKQDAFLKRDKYLKQVVYIDDWPPPPTGMEQAKRLKELWYRFTYEGSESYIAIDGWQYGKSVVENLMMDLGDGLAPLCVYQHDTYTELELPGAEPVIYPVKAGGVGVTDPDAEMVRYAEMQFENHNVELLVQNRQAGVEAYKEYHRIKDDYADLEIDRPYRKTKDLVGQIQNLRKVPSGAGMMERRISRRIQRDSWSALKYAMRMAQKLERRYLITTRPQSDWTELLEQYADGGEYAVAPVARKRSVGRMAVGYHGGRIT